MKVLAFDVNETLLDLAALDPLFDGFFGSPLTRKEWFSETLKLGFTSTITGYYEPFPKLALAALETLEQRYDKPLTSADRERLSAAMLSLPPLPDAAPALKQISSLGHTVVALANNTGENLESQLRNAKLWDYFRHIFSADAVQRLKPAKEAYLFVARTMQVPLSDIMMVAAHPWDIAGAQAAGLSAAFIARPGQYLNALVPAPRFTATSLTHLADQLANSAQLEKAS
ncbi:MAG: haloacid dehalogenase type II [Acidobacteriaceae bacterium]